MANWYPVEIQCNNHYEGMKDIKVTTYRPITSDIHPGDEIMQTNNYLSKCRWFSSKERAEEVASTLSHLRIGIRRKRPTVTQGEVEVFLNGKKMLTFGDQISLPSKNLHIRHRVFPNGMYGENISGWQSTKPDSNFVLSLIWPAYDNVYHYSDEVCRKLKVSPRKWIEEI